MRVLAALALFLFCAAFAPSAQAAIAVPAAIFFPVLPMNAPDNEMPQLVPLAANHAIGDVQTGVTRAIIIVHDVSRDANGALATVSALAGTDNGSTLIIAPQFLLSTDISRFSDHLPESGHSFAAWSMTGWQNGDDSFPSPGHQGVSSFTVIDLLLMMLSDRARFPNLQKIVLAGWGSGANFVQRYAAFGRAAPVMAQQNVEIDYLAADAASYLYLTPNRFIGKDFQKPVPASCPDYDNYPYGLQKLNPYAARVGANAAQLDYSSRRVTYIAAATVDAEPDNNCAAMQQGMNGAARERNYELYLQTIYGDAAKTQQFYVASGTANDAVGLLGSPCGMAVLFGNGVCGSMQ